MNELDQLPIPLLQWYHENARVLPWRSDPTPYHVWISEIMLQQTRVAAVLGYYARFLSGSCRTSSSASRQTNLHFLPDFVTIIIFAIINRIKGDKTA